MTASRPRLRLVTIGPSHFCEKARWALDRAAIRYEEERHPPLLHWTATARLGRRRTVPILVTPHGILGDSSAILAFADRGLSAPVRLYPHEDELRREVQALETRLGAELGPAARRIAYAHLLNAKNALVNLLTEGTGPLEAAVFRLGRPGFVAAMRRGLKLSEAHVMRSRQRLDAVFREVEARIADGRRYLFGDRFTAADLTFASLAAPVLGPPEYAVRVDGVGTELPDLAAEVARYRATPAGEFALRLFREERRRVVAGREERTV